MYATINENARSNTTDNGIVKKPLMKGSELSKYIWWPVLHTSSYMEPYMCSVWPIFRLCKYSLVYATSNILTPKSSTNISCLTWLSAKNWLVEIGSNCWKHSAISKLARASTSLPLWLNAIAIDCSKASLDWERYFWAILCSV